MKGWTKTTKNHETQEEKLEISLWFLDTHYNRFCYIFILQNRDKFVQ